MGASVASHWNSPVVGSGRFTVNEGYMAQLSRWYAPLVDGNSMPEYDAPGASVKIGLD